MKTAVSGKGFWFIEPVKRSLKAGSVESVVELDDSMRRGVTSLPHCDPLSKTPYYKYVQVEIEKRPG